MNRYMIETTGLSDPSWNFSTSQVVPQIRPQAARDRKSQRSGWPPAWW